MSVEPSYISPPFWISGAGFEAEVAGLGVEEVDLEGVVTARDFLVCMGGSEGWAFEELGARVALLVEVDLWRMRC